MKPKEKAIYNVLSKRQLSGKEPIKLSHVEKLLDIALKAERERVEKVIDEVKKKWEHCMFCDQPPTEGCYKKHVVVIPIEAVKELKHKLGFK